MWGVACHLSTKNHVYICLVFSDSRAECQLCCEFRSNPSKIKKHKHPAQKQTKETLQFHPPNSFNQINKKKTSQAFKCVQLQLTNAGNYHRNPSLATLAWCLSRPSIRSLACLWRSSSWGRSDAPLVATPLEIIAAWIEKTWYRKSILFSHPLGVFRFSSQKRPQLHNNKRSSWPSKIKACFESEASTRPWSPTLKASNVQLELVHINVLEERFKGFQDHSQMQQPMISCKMVWADLYLAYF